MSKRNLAILKIVGIVIIAWMALFVIRKAAAFGPIPKPAQCISVNAMIQRSCAPVYMCNGPKDTNASWCCSSRWAPEEQKLLRWYKENCEKWIPISEDER